MVLYYDMDSNPITQDEGLKYMKGENNRVAYTVLPDGGYISTIFLVIDHNWDSSGKPILFESMCFGPNSKERETLRYSTKKEAEFGHDAMVKRHLDKYNAQVRAAKCEGLTLSAHNALVKESLDKHHAKGTTKLVPVPLTEPPTYLGIDFAADSNMEHGKGFFVTSGNAAEIKNLWVDKVMKLKAEEAEVKLAAKMAKILNMPNPFINSLSKWNWDDT
jgi:hypothetical protein